MTFILIYIMFLFIMFFVYFEYAFDMVIVIFKFMHRITERLTQYSSGLSSQILCKHGAFFACGCALHSGTCGRLGG